jgi:hypothetical protein
MLACGASKRPEMTVARPVGEGHDDCSCSVGLSGSTRCGHRYFRYRYRCTRFRDSARPGRSHGIHPGRNSPQWIVCALCSYQGVSIQIPFLWHLVPQVRDATSWRALPCSPCQLQAAPAQIPSPDVRTGSALPSTHVHGWPPSAFAAHMDVSWHPTPSLLRLHASCGCY